MERKQDCLDKNQKPGELFFFYISICQSRICFFFFFGSWVVSSKMIYLQVTQPLRLPHFKILLYTICLKALKFHYMYRLMWYDIMVNYISVLYLSYCCCGYWFSIFLQRLCVIPSLWHYRSGKTDMKLKFLKILSCT